MRVSEALMLMSRVPKLESLGMLRRHQEIAQRH
jgi:hypothetical protein